MTYPEAAKMVRQYFNVKDAPGVTKDEQIAVLITATRHGRSLDRMNREDFERCLASTKALFVRLMVPK